MKAELSLIKRTLKRSKIAIIAYCIYQNYKAKRQIGLGNFETSSGSHSKMNVAESLQYIDTVFKDYLDYADLTPDFMRDKTILEVGPGDNFGVALKFLAFGAKKVVCLDRFFSKRDEEKNKKVYRALREALPNELRARLEGLSPAAAIADFFDSRKLAYTLAQA